MAVAVDEQVDAGHVGGNIHGTVGDAFVSIAQMGQAHDQVAFGGLQLGHLGLRHGVKLLGLGKGDALYLVGVRLGHGFGGGKAEHANLHAGNLKHLVGAKHQRAVGGAGEIGAQHGKRGVGHVLLHVVGAPVKFMVAQGGHIVAGGIHEINRVFAVAKVYDGGALREVAGIHQQYLGAAGFQTLLEGGHAGVAERAAGGNGAAVHIVGVQDDQLASQITGCFLGHSGREGAQQHGQGQYEGKNLFHGNLPSFRLSCGKALLHWNGGSCKI